MNLPSGLDVYAVLSAALQQEEYRAHILFIVGVLWGFGFMTGFLICAIFSPPYTETKKSKDRRNQ